VVQADLLISDVAPSFERAAPARRRSFSLPSLASKRLAVRRHLEAAFCLAWEAQSQIATVAYVALTGFGSVWVALPIMLVWSLISTIVYCFARRKGAPDLLTVEVRGQDQRRGFNLRTATASFAKVWMVGFQAFAFTHASGRLLELKGSRCPKRRVVRVALLGVGLTLFGVSSAEHLLRRAGFEGSRLVKLSLIGPFLNVPYRVLLSAAFMHFVWSIVHVLDVSSTL